jgi:glycosyltransferase involved in cell wall biosynthesis
VSDGECPAVSIIVPLYNGAGTIAETLESLRSQTYQNLEVIVIDDGSTDQSAEIAQRFSNVFRYVYQPNAGQSCTLNSGWSMAKGRYLSYLSADDILYPNAVETLIKNLEENPSISVIYPDYNLIDINSRVMRRINAPDFNPRDLVEKIIVQPGPAAFFRREVFEATKGWRHDLKIAADFDFWLRAQARGSFARYPHVLAGLRIHSKSQSVAPLSERNCDEPIRVVQEFFAETAAEHIRWRRDYSMASAYAVSARFHMRSARWHSACERIAAALRLDPSLLLQIRFWRLIAGGIRNFLSLALRHS